jgi:hypothetical protein
MRNKFTLGDEVYVVSTSRDATTDKVHAILIRDTIVSLWRTKTPKGVHPSVLAEEIVELSCGLRHHACALAFTVEEAFERVEQNHKDNWEAIAALFIQKSPEVSGVEIRDFTGKTEATEIRSTQDDGGVPFAMGGEEEVVARTCDNCGRFSDPKECTLNFGIKNVLKEMPDCGHWYPKKEQKGNSDED